MSHYEIEHATGHARAYLQARRDLTASMRKCYHTILKWMQQIGTFEFRDDSEEWFDLEMDLEYAGNYLDLWFHPEDASVEFQIIDLYWESTAESLGLDWDWDRLSGEDRARVDAQIRTDFQTIVEGIRADYAPLLAKLRRSSAIARIEFTVLEDMTNAPPDGSSPLYILEYEANSHSAIQQRVAQFREARQTMRDRDPQFEQDLAIHELTRMIFG
jgi:hypothetical protein